MPRNMTCCSRAATSSIQRTRLADGVTSPSKMAGSPQSRPRFRRQSRENGERRGPVCHARPGDLHVHVFAGTGTAYTGPSSVRPDDHSFRSGVTTMVDAGSSGLAQLRGFQAVDYRSGPHARARDAEYRGRGHGRRPPSRTCKTWIRTKPPRWRRNTRTSLSVSRPHTMLVLSGLRSRMRSKPAESPGLPIMVDFGQFRPERPVRRSGNEKTAARRHLYTHVSGIGAHAGRNGPAAPLSVRRLASVESCSTLGMAAAVFCSARLYLPSNRDSCPTPFRPTCTLEA